jgi:hypothetical protein
MSLAAYPKEVVILFKVWLAFEICVHIFFAAYFIPKFFFWEPFVIQTKLNATCAQQRVHFKQDQSLIETLVEVEKAREELHKTANGTSACYDEVPEILWEGVVKEATWWGPPHGDPESTTFKDTLPHKMNAAMLFVCGLCAPFGEVLIRLLNNIFYSIGFESKRWHMIYEVSHGPLQHLTQFKLYLCFLQSLLSIDVLGISAIKMTPSSGLRHFTIFVAWSIFINTVIKKLEKPIKRMNEEGASETPFLAQILPPPDWMPKLLAKYTGRRSHLRTVASIVKLFGLYLFYTHPLFTLIYNYEPSPGSKHMQHCPDLKDATSVKYFSHSLKTVHQGLVTMFQTDLAGQTWLLLLLVFQFFICNLIPQI